MNYEEFNKKNENDPLVAKFSEEASERLFDYVPHDESWQPYYENSMELTPQEAYDALIPLREHDSTIESDEVWVEIVDELLANGKDGYDRLYNGNYLLIRK